MTNMKITVRALDSLKPPEDVVLIWDQELPGFGIRVQPTGRIVFIAQFKKLGKSKRVTIGQYGRPWTVDTARKEAKAIFAKIEAGDAISGGRRGLIKISEVAEKWMTQRVRPHRKPRTISDYADKLRLYILPTFGDAAAEQVTREDVVTWHNSMKHIPRTANYALVVLSGLFNFGIETDLIPRTHVNPAHRLQKFPEQQVERFLSRDEMARIGQAMRDLETEGKLSLFSAAALRLLIYTGARVGEVLVFRWDWVDLERQTIFMPTSKTGKKSIFLNGEAVAVLRGLMRVKGNPHVIVGQNEGEPMESLRKPWLTVCKRADIVDCRIHDLRHSFASFAVMGGLSLPEVGKLLGHKLPSTTQRYAHLSDDHAKTNNQTVGQVIGSLINRPSADDNKVVPMPRKAS